MLLLALLLALLETPLLLALALFAGIGFALAGVALAVWAIGMLPLALQDERELSQRTYFYMLFATLAVWAVSTVRDARRLLRTRAQKDGR